MERRRLGSSELEITPVGFGAWAAGGGGWWGGYGAQDDADSIAAIHRALQRGVNWIDTAPIYGLGHSEDVVGRALRDLGANDRPLVFTKVGLRFDKPTDEVVVDLDPARLHQEVDSSLDRLGLDHVDLLQVHWPPEPADDDGHIEAAWEALVAIRDAGKTRFIGVSNFDAGQLARIAAIEPAVSLQPPYSLINREVEAEVLPHAAANDIGVIVYSPLASGLLGGGMTAERAGALAADDWRRTSPDFQEPKLGANLAAAERVRAAADRLGRTSAQVAVGWVLRNPAVTGAIVGFRSPAHVDALIDAGTLALDDETARTLEGATP